MNWRKIVLLVLGLMVSLPMLAFSQFARVSTFLHEQTNSPRALGMGGASITLIDEQSAFHNPGAVGLYHLDYRVGVSTPNSRTKSLSGTTLESWNISVGHRFTIHPAGAADVIHLSVAGAYSQTGDESFGTSPGIGTITRRSFLESTNTDIFTFAIGFERKIRIGVGGSYKRGDSSREQIPFDMRSFGIGGDAGMGSTLDLGIIIDVPLHKIFWQVSKSATAQKKTHLEITPRLALVRASTNRSFVTSFSTRNTGYFNLSGVGLDFSFVNNNTKQLTFNLVAERETQVFDFTGSRSNATTHYGIELALREALFLRTGWEGGRFSAQSSGLAGVGTVIGGIIQGGSIPEPSRKQSFGVGLRLSGLVNLLSPKSANTGDATSGGLLRKLDVKLDYGDNRVNRSVFKVSLSMRH